MQLRKGSLRFYLLVVLAVWLVVGVTPGRALAANCEWTGATSIAWEVAGNWTGCEGGVPGADDTATIPGGATNQPFVSREQTVASLSVESGATLTIEQTTNFNFAALTVGNGATNAGTIVLSSNADIPFPASLSLNAGTLVNTGTIRTLSETANSGNQFIGATVDNQGLLDVQRDLEVDGFINQPSGTVTIADGQRLVLAFDEHTFTYNGGPITGGGTLLMGTNARLVLNADLSNEAFILLLNGGFVRGSNRLTNAAGQTMEGFGQIETPFTNVGTLAVDFGFSISNTVGSFVNPGTIVISGTSGTTGLFTVNGFTNAGVIEMTTADTNFGGERRLQVDNGTLVNTGTIRSVLGDGIGPDEVRTVAATLDNQGTLQGVLTVEGDVTNGGTVVPRLLTRHTNHQWRVHADRSG